MKKIIIISGIYPKFKGGAEYQMRLIADQLKDQFKIVFIYLGDIPGKPVSKTHYEYIDGYKVYFLQSCSKKEALFLKYFYAKRLYKIIEAEKPDIVYQRVYKFLSYYISSYQKKLNFKHFIHIADLFTITFNLEQWRQRFNFLFFKKTVANKSKFIVQTSEQNSIMQSYNIIPVLQLYNMHPIEEVDIVTLSNQKYHNKIKHILWVANIRPIKQLEKYIDLAKYYKENNSYQFHIIGDVQDINYASTILEEINHLPNVHHYSGKDNNFVNDFIKNKASLVVNSSSSEGFSNVFIQSWLKGVPVLSLNSDPDGLITKYNILGKYCKNDMINFQEGLHQILSDKAYNNNALECYTLSKSLFSFENINKLNKLFS